MAFNRDVDVTLHEEGKGTYAEVSKGKIFLEDLSDNLDVLIGLGFHELGHVLLTECIDYTKEFGVPEEEVRALHNQVNSLEDYRIEHGVSLLYPPAEFYLKTVAHWFRMKGIQKMMVGNISGNPSFALHLHLANLDFTRYEEKDLRMLVRQISAELKDMHFEQIKSTREMYPVAKAVYDRLKPHMPKSEGDPPALENPFVVHVAAGDMDNKGKGKEKVIAVKAAFEGKEPGSGNPTLDLYLDVEERSMEKEEAKPAELMEIPLRTRIAYETNKDYVRPYEPEVLKKNKPMAEDEYQYGIASEIAMIDEGRRVGRKLIEELKFKEGTKRRLEDGELDVDDLIESLQENQGKLKSFDVFTDNTPLIHDHTVLILIDMSGSMSGHRIKTARGAALMLAKALEEMNVPYSLRGFSAETNKLQIHDVVIKDFEEPLSLNKLKTMFIGDQNRDSDSIRHAVNLIRAEKGKKLIFVISDGQPHHPDGVTDYRAFNMNCTQDVYEACKAAAAEGISVIGIGITFEASHFIRETYQKGFTITELSELPEKLLKIYLQESEGLRQTWRASILTA